MNRFEQAFSEFEHSLANGRLAHAHLIEGDPRTAGQELACKMINRILDGVPDGASTISRHPDVHWIEPEKKSRIISMAQMQDLCHALHATSYSGGWKAAVVQFADRMNKESSNAFLKTLEEPPARCLLLLLTDKPEALLPTIRSRCQLIRLRGEERVEEQPWLDELLNVLRAGPPSDPLDVLSRAGEMELLLKAQQSRIEDEVGPKGEDEDKDLYEARISAKLLESRRMIMRYMDYWQRDLLMLLSGDDELPLFFESERAHLQRQAAALDRSKILRFKEIVDVLNARMESNLPPSFALTAAFLKQGITARG